MVVLAGLLPLAGVLLGYLLMTAHTRAAYLRHVYLPPIVNTQVPTSADLNSIRE
jgi:hypothetical protein